MGDAEEHVIAAAYHMVKALEATSNNLSNDMRRILADLDVHLSSTMTAMGENKANKTREIEDRLRSAHETITGLHSSHSRIWNSNPAIVSEYLEAIDDVARTIEALESFPLKKTWKHKELLDRAQCTLQIAMMRLQDELVHILQQNNQHFRQEYVSIDEESIMSNEGNPASQRESSNNNNRSSNSNSSMADNVMEDLVHPNTVLQIASIVKAMFTSHYGQEFCHAFVRFWRCELAEYLTILNVEQFSVEDVLKMEWKSLNLRIRKWRRAMKSICGNYLVNMKRLFDQVLGEYGSISSTCLVDVSRASLLCLLNFGHAVAIGPHTPEWLYCLLDMFEVLASLTADVEALFPYEAGGFISVEFHELLRRLGDSAKVIFMEFGNHIASRASRMPFTNGGIHPLTKYVVNYILCFVEYGDTLNLLLAGEDETNSDNENVHGMKIAVHLQSVTTILEANLDVTSNLYNNACLKHVFMMNNIHYMVDKIKNSDVRSYFGDEWIRKQIGKFQQHARGYERVTWSSILNLIRDDGKTGKTTLKDRCRDFSVAFEDVYKIQTAWLVPNLELREDLRISTSKTVIPAYRNFVGKITNSIGEKYIKYSVHDLETYILDLLEGSAKSLKPPRMNETTILSNISLFPYTVFNKII